MYIRNEIVFEDLSTLVTASSYHDIEISTVHLLRIRVFVILVYIPPNVKTSVLHDLRSSIVATADGLLTQFPDNHLVILGDFNLFKVDWLCDDLDLIDLITKPTRKNSILDHCLISNELVGVYSLKNVTYDAPVANSDHVMISVIPTGKSDEAQTKKLHVVVYDFRKSRLEALNAKISQVKWDEIIYPQEDIDLLWRKFHSVFSHAISQVIPCKEVWLSPTDKEWMTPLTKMLINERWSAYRQRDWKRYNELKYKVKNEILKSRKIQADKLKRTAHGLWRFVNVISGKKNSDTWSSLVSQHGDVNNLLSAVVANFKDVSEPTSEDSKRETELQDDNWSIVFKEIEIEKLLRNLSPHKATGIDGIPNKLYAAVAVNIVTPLKCIYEASISQRTFPNAWKVGMVTPIPKTNPPDVTKLRPITLLPTPAKILEKIVHRKMKSFYEKAFSRNQHAFRSGHSTSTALVEVNEATTKIFDDQSSFGSCTICLDLSKAFDLVDHNLVIDRLQQLNFPSGHLLWLKSYLDGRTCHVKIEGQLSCSYQVMKGVPQGSVLGPAIFCAFTGDFNARCSKSTVVKYADDITIIMPFEERDSDTIAKMIKDELQFVNEWCSRKKLRLNKDKSNILLHTRTPIILPPSLNVTTNVKVLGTILSDDLTWDAHVSTVARTFTRRFHILRKLKKVVTREELHQIYTSIMRPLLEYASPVFVSLTKKLEKKLQRLDNRAHKLIWGNSTKNCKCDKEILRKRREKTSKDLFKCITKNQNHSLFQYLPQRMKCSRRYMTFFCRTEKRRNSFFPFVTELVGQDTDIVE